MDTETGDRTIETDATTAGNTHKEEKEKKKGEIFGLRTYKIDKALATKSYSRKDIAKQISKREEDKREIEKKIKEQEEVLEKRSLYQHNVQTDVATVNVDLLEQERARLRALREKLETAQEVRNILEERLDFVTVAQRVGMITLSLLLVTFGVWIIVKAGLLSGTKERVSVALPIVSIQTHTEILLSDNTESVLIENVNKEFITTILNKQYNFQDIIQILVQQEISIADGSSALRAVSMKELFTSLSITTPITLDTGLSNTFFYGVSESFGNYPFLVVGIHSYQQSYLGMLQWEQSLGSDMSVLLNTPPEVYSFNFIDGVQNNIDIRALIDNERNQHIVYGFVGKKYLIITTNGNTFNRISQLLSL